MVFIQPSLHVPTVLDLNLDYLKSQGIRGFIFDLDNTLMWPHSGSLRPEMKKCLDSLRAEGFPYIVLTNNKNQAYLQEVKQILQVPIIGPAHKPQQKGFYQAMDLLRLEVQEIAVVGDQVLTDMLGGTLFGAYTILVDPLNKEEEHVFYRYCRLLERQLIRS